MSPKDTKTVRPDAKGRITLGSLTKGVSGYVVTKDKNNRVILEPMVEIPAEEKWLFDNKMALHQVQQGLLDSANGNLISRGNFGKYAEDDSE
jgi:hypothetical protein